MILLPDATRPTSHADRAGHAKRRAQTARLCPTPACPRGVHAKVWGRCSSLTDSLIDAHVVWRHVPPGPGMQPPCRQGQHDTVGGVLALAVAVAVGLVSSGRARRRANQAAVVATGESLDRTSPALGMPLSNCKGSGRCRGQGSVCSVRWHSRAMDELTVMATSGHMIDRKIAVPMTGFKGQPP
jgi:hypothetical protein